MNVRRHITVLSVVTAPLYHDRESDDHHVPFYTLWSSVLSVFQNRPRSTKLEVQVLPGHNDVKTTMIDSHVMNRSGLHLTSPLDRLK